MKIKIVLMRPIVNELHEFTPITHSSIEKLSVNICLFSMHNTENNTLRLMAIDKSKNYANVNIE